MQHVIDSAIRMLVSQLNNYFNNQEKVIASNLVNQSGSLVNNLAGKIALSLVNIEEDRISRSLNNYRQLPNGQQEKINPEVKLNLYVMFTAVADQAGEPFINTIENLSRVIGFFQTKNYFDHLNTPSMSQHIEQIIVDTYSLTFEQQNHLWGSLGAKYMPSILYKLRLVKIQEEEVLSEGPPILNVDTNIQELGL